MLVANWYRTGRVFGLPPGGGGGGEGEDGGEDALARWLLTTDY